MRMLEAEETAVEVDEEEDMEPTINHADDGGSHWDLPSSHITYLSDSNRLKFYYQTIASNQFKDKVVIDAGCGAGALSLLLAKAGAKHVIAVEQSKAAAEMARRNVEASGLSQKVTVIEGRVQDVSVRDLPDQQKADAIIHDGFGLMLTSPLTRGLIAAKRRLLKPDGVLCPSKATLHIAGVEDKAYLSSQKEQAQDLVPGIDLSPGLMPAVVLTPRVARLERASSLFTNTCDLFTLDLSDPDSKHVAIEGFLAPFSIRAERDERLMALICWISFGSPSGQVFDGRPEQDSSKAQLFLNFPKSLRLSKGDVIEGMVTVNPLHQSRANTVFLAIQFQGSTAQCEYRLPENISESIF
jgi:SAM-dependent methyltransferase